MDISERDVAENAIAENMLDVLDTLDEMLSGADQRLMEMEVKPLQIKKEEGHTNKPGESVKFSFKLPAWKTMMDEDTPPGSPFSRSLFAEGHTEGESVMELVSDHLVKNSKEIKAKAEPFEPLVTSTAAVRAMFEKFLGPSKTAETAETAKSAKNASGEGHLQQMVEKTTAAEKRGEGQAQQDIQDKVFMEKIRDSVSPVVPRIIRRRQQKPKEDGAHKVQAAVVASQPERSKFPPHSPCSKHPYTHKHIAETKASGSPTHRERKGSVSEFRKAAPPMETPKEEGDHEPGDYYYSSRIKANSEKPTPPAPTLCSYPTLRKVKSWSGPFSSPALELADSSLLPGASIVSIKTQSSGVSRNSSDEAQADTSASSVPSAEPRPKYINPVAANIPKAEFKVTGGDRERYKPTGKLALLLAARKAGIVFTETETLQGILEKGRKAVSDESERASKLESATSGQSDDGTSMDDAQLELEGVGPYKAHWRNDPFTTPKKNVFAGGEDNNSVYSRPSGFTGTGSRSRGMGSLKDEGYRGISAGSPPLRRTQQIRRNSRRTSAPNSAVGRYIAGPDANQEEVTKTSPASTISLTARVPKELRMLGLTMEELFMDPETGDFIEPDRSIGGTAELRRKYETEGRGAWVNGELSMKTLQRVLKEREKERSLTESMFSEGAKRMPPPKSKPSKGGSKSKFGMHRQRSTPASIAATLFTLSRKASEPTGSSLKSSKRRAPTSLASDDKGRSSGIGAGMRRIFAGNFGSKSSNSVIRKGPIDKSMISVITSSTASGEVKASSMMSIGSTRASAESVLPAASIASIQNASAASVGSSTESSKAGSIRGSIKPQPCAAAHESNGDRAAQPAPGKVEPRKLPSPPPNRAHHATARYGNTIKAPVTKAGQKEKLAEATEEKTSLFDFPMPPTTDHGARSSSDSASVPEIQLSPPVTVAGKHFGYNPHHRPTPSRLPTPAHPVALKRPSTGAGSRPISRTNSRTGSRPNSRIGQRTTSRNSLTGGGRRGSVNSLTAGGRRNSVSSIFTISRPTSRAASRAGMTSRAGTTSRAGATSRVGAISRQKGVANLRMLENKQQPPQASAAPKMGSSLMGGRHDELRAGNRLGGYGDERVGSRAGSRMAPPPKMAPLIQSASRATGSFPTKPDGARVTSKLGSYQERRADSQTSTYTGRDSESGDQQMANTSREWLVRDIPMGTRLPAPHLMSSPGGRYPKPIGSMVGGGRVGNRGPGSFPSSGSMSPALMGVGREREDGNAQGKRERKNIGGKRGGEA